MEDNDRDIQMAAQIAQPFDILTQNSTDTLLRSCQFRSRLVANLSDEQRRNGKSKRVDDESGLIAQGAGYQAAKGGAERQHNRPGGGADRVGSA